MVLRETGKGEERTLDPLLISSAPSSSFAAASFPPVRLRALRLLLLLDERSLSCGGRDRLIGRFRVLIGSRRGRGRSRRSGWCLLRLLGDVRCRS